MKMNDIVCNIKFPAGFKNVLVPAVYVFLFLFVALTA